MKKQYDVKIIESIIYRYSENNLGTLIKPRAIFEYANELFEKKEIPYKLSYDFWRKPQYLGKQLIGKTNGILKIGIIDNEIELINETTKYAESLNEKGNYLEVKKQLNEKMQQINELEEENLILKNELEKAISKSEKYKKTIFSIIAASTYSNDPFYNFMKGDIDQNPVVKTLFNNIFPDEINLEDELRKYAQTIILENNKTKDIITLEEGRISKFFREKNKQK